MRQVNIRMTEQLRDQVDERAEELGFNSRADYIRYLARNDLQRVGGSNADA